MSTFEPSFDDLAAARSAERKFISQLEKNNPDRLGRAKTVSADDLLPRIGITGIPTHPPGYLRFLPQDFIVEEVGQDESLATVEPSSLPVIGEHQAPTIYANLVKVGLGTPEATAALASVLKIPPEKIGYAGIKDARAVTSQRVSIRGTTLDAVLPFIQPRAIPQIYLNLLATGKGAVSIGQLKGNRFTILIRTPANTDLSATEKLSKQLVKDGFPNFYGPQRFGSRLLNPYLGRLLCQGQPDQAIKLYLTQAGLFDPPIYREIRQTTAKLFGQWDKMYDKFSPLAYSFRHERRLLRALISSDGDLIQALYAIQDQVRFWVYGYASFLVNRLLSYSYSGRVNIPDPLPLPLSNTMEADQLYHSFLSRHETISYRVNLAPYRFLIQKERDIEPWIMPAVHNFTPCPSGLIISFTLPKAAYATTFLYFLFNLYEGKPIPDWVNTDPVDTKAILKTGSVQAALDYLLVPEVT